MELIQTKKVSLWKGIIRQEVGGWGCIITYIFAHGIKSRFCFAMAENLFCNMYLESLWTSLSPHQPLKLLCVLILLKCMYKEILVLENIISSKFLKKYNPELLYYNDVVKRVLNLSDAWTDSNPCRKEIMPKKFILLVKLKYIWPALFILIPQNRSVLNNSMKSLR